MSPRPIGISGSIWGKRNPGSLIPVLGSSAAALALTFPANPWNDADIAGTISATLGETNLVCGLTTGSIRATAGYLIGGVGWAIFSFGMPIDNATYSGWCNITATLSAGGGAPGATSRIWESSLGQKYTDGGSATNYGSAAAVNSTVTHILHVPSGKNFLAVNNVLQNSADLAALTGEMFTLPAGTFYPVFGNAGATALNEYQTVFSRWS